MRKAFAVTAASLLLAALAAEAQPPNRKGGGRGGFAAKNLQVLDPATLPEAMQSYVQALGLLDKGVCNYCHVEDRASNEKIQKVIARNMITMVREINAHFADARQHVTCYTCHRGSTTPLMAP